MLVTENFRGFEIGKLLIDYLEPPLSLRDCSSFEVASNIKRESTHPFYKKCGFN